MDKPILRFMHLSITRSRLARLFLFVAAMTISALQTGCVILPFAENNQRIYLYSENAVSNLDEGQIVYRIQQCNMASSQEKQGYLSMASACERNSGSSLVVRQTGWNFLQEATVKQENPFGDGFKIEPQTFQRPATASRNTSSRFVGYFGDKIFVWASPAESVDRSDQLSKPTYSFEKIEYRNDGEHSRVPALVVRDGDDIWIFVERRMPCTDDLCYPVAKTLGIDAAPLPENLRGKFMLFHANIKTSSELERVFSPQLSVNLHRKIVPLPMPGNKFDLDLNASPRVRFNTFLPQVKCEQETIYSTWMVFPVMRPMGEDQTNLKGCMQYKLDGVDAARKEVFAPDPLEASTAPDPTDPMKLLNNVPYYFMTPTLQK
jgi:hypothetical protein